MPYSALFTRHKYHAPACAPPFAVLLDSGFNLAGLVLVLPLVIVAGTVVIEIKHLFLVFLKECKELVGEFTHRVRRQLVKVFMNPVILSVRLGDNKRKHITEVHTSFQRSGGVEVTELRTVKCGFS